MPGVTVAYKKGSVDRMLIDEYCSMRLADTPRPLSRAWYKWLEAFSSKHLDQVSRMKEPLQDRAIKVLRYDIPDFD